MPSIPLTNRSYPGLVATPMDGRRISGLVIHRDSTLLVKEARPSPFQEGVSCCPCLEDPVSTSDHRTRSAWLFAPSLNQVPMEQFSACDSVVLRLDTPMQAWAPLEVAGDTKGKPAAHLQPLMNSVAPLRGDKDGLVVSPFNGSSLSLTGCPLSSVKKGTPCSLVIETCWIIVTLVFSLLWWLLNDVIGGGAGLDIITKHQPRGGRGGKYGAWEEIQGNRFIGRYIRRSSSIRGRHG